jgi:hypothetical protein
MEEKLIKKLIASITCGSCGQHYDEDSIKVIERSEDLWFLQVHCPGCDLKCLVAAIIRDDYAVPEIVTDLTETELEKFYGAEGVRTDDVLDMHEFLKEFDGDFPRIFHEG